MKIYLLIPKDCPGPHSDKYDAVVVVAENEDDAKTITPHGEPLDVDVHGYWVTNAADLDCTEIGEANESQERGIILSSFNPS